MKRKKKYRQRILCELNITNLVDVTFALLIIFMITAPMMTQGVQVDLPRADSENVEVNESIQISINERSEIFINQKRISLLEFDKEFKRVFGDRIDIPVFINADKRVPYGIVVRVISFIQKAGVVKLGFLTEPVTIR